jgi:lipooligosaccharide transport system permease protein
MALTLRQRPAAGGAALRSFQYWLFQYRRTWRGSLVSTFANPLLYLAAMGVGLGSLVNRSAGAAQLGGVGYLSFIAPGVLAAAAMQTAAGESTYPVMASIKWIKTYHAMLATPLGVQDVLVGHLAWMAVRLTMTSTAFLAALALFGTLHSPLAVLALPVAILTGLAFATPITAFAATQTNDAGFALLFRLGIMPLFLFSGVFFPVDRLPGLLRPVAYATPLWHGVDLCRALTLGSGLTPAGAAVHVAYLTAFALGGFAAARITYRKALVR